MTPHERASPEERQRSALLAALAHTGLTLEDLWMRYFALGGDADLMEIDAHLSGLAELPILRRDILAHAVNERLDELLTQHRVPYSRVLRQSHPATGPLAALVTLLGAAGSAPPQRLPTLVAAAGQILGVVVVHLIDPERRRLVWMPTAHSPGGLRQGVEGTLAARAFRTVRTLASERDGTLWVPVLDGADRLGVLEVKPASRADLYDPRSVFDQARASTNSSPEASAAPSSRASGRAGRAQRAPALRQRRSPASPAAPQRQHGEGADRRPAHPVRAGEHGADGRRGGPPAGRLAGPLHRRRHRGARRERCLVRRGTAGGVPDARDRRGSAPAGNRPKKLTQAVLAHRGGVLQDDASILLACWIGARLS